MKTKGKQFALWYFLSLVALTKYKLFQESTQKVHTILYDSVNNVNTEVTSSTVCSLSYRANLFQVSEHK